MKWCYRLISYLLIICLMSGCSHREEITKNDFELSHHIEDLSYEIGDTVNININFENKYKDVTIMASNQGPIRYAIMHDETLIQGGAELSIAKKLEFKKEDILTRNVSFDITKQGKYEIAFNSEFVYNGKTYDFWSDSIIIEVE